MNTVEQEQQSNKTQKDRLDKAINRLASRRIVFQIISTIPGFILELYYGIKYINECPIQPLINVFLITHGCLSLVNGIILLVGFLTVKHIKHSLTPSVGAQRLCIASLAGQLVYLIFSIACLVVGQVWVFGAQTRGFQSSNSTDSATYCHSNVLWNGFIIIIVTYAVWFITLVISGVRKIIKNHKMKQATVLKINERV